MKTVYEKLKEQADACRVAAIRTTGKMREIWVEKANALELEAGNMPLVVACENYDTYAARKNYFNEKELQNGSY